MELLLPSALALPQDTIRFALPPLEALFDIEPLVLLHARLEERLNGQSGSDAIGHRLEELRQRLKSMPFEEATAVDDRERLLLALYLLDTGKADVAAYLPAFDEGLCEQILGAPGALSTAWRLRQAAQLFFMHLDRLPGWLVLGRLLQRALAVPKAGRIKQANVQAWRKGLAWLFGGNGPERLVEHALPGEKLAATAGRYHVPFNSRFVELAHQRYFQALLTIPLGQDGPLFDELIERRNTILSGGRLLGVAALEILISRSIAENNGQIPAVWGARLAALSCDPRLPRQSPEFNRWWSWAGQQELSVALSWFTGRDVEAFLLLLEQSLEGSEARMLPRRAAFLRGIYNSGKMIQARLGLVGRARAELAGIFPDAAEGGSATMRSNDGISVLCVQCDGFSFVEGTDNFAIQLHHEFPIPGFWEGADLAVEGERTALRFGLPDFRKNRIASIPHTDSAMMKWEHKFLNALKTAPFYLRWTDVPF